MAFDAKDPDTIEAVAKIVAGELEKAEHLGVADLKVKNTELLKKLKKAQKDSLIDPADHAALQSELDANEIKLAAAEKALKTAITESDKIKKSYETESKVAHNLLVENGLSTALLEAGIKKPSYLKAAKAMLAGQVILTADGDKRVAMVGDKKLAEFIKDWAGGDEGKTFVDAPGNSGGNAPGGGTQLSDEAMSKMSPEARLQALNTAGAEK